MNAGTKPMINSRAADSRLKRQLAGSAQHIYSSKNRINVHQTDGAGVDSTFSTKASSEATTMIAG